MANIESPARDVSLAIRWRQNRLDMESGRPLTFVLTPAQIAAAKLSIKEDPSLGLICFRSVLPISTGIDVNPGESTTASIRIRLSESPYRFIFADRVANYFEVDQVSLGISGGVLRSRDRGDLMDLASIEYTLCRIVIPACVDVKIAVRNIDSAPHPFICAILSAHSAVERRADLLRNCSPDRRPLAYASWWGEQHQRIVNLSEEEARQIDATLGSCADGTPRRRFSFSCAACGVVASGG
jgi:hypothetical protein